jgi:hypothetical protein
MVASWRQKIKRILVKMWYPWCLVMLQEIFQHLTGDNLTYAMRATPTHKMNTENMPSIGQH